VSGDPDPRASKKDAGSPLYSSIFENISFKDEL